MKSKKLRYCEALMNTNSKWILGSFQNPNKYMTKTDLLIHAVVYRRLTGINLYTLKKD